MATAVQMPKLGNSVEECLLVEWQVKVGDEVAEEDTLCAIETDKAAFEVPSPIGGHVLALLCEEGDLVPVLTDILVIGAAGEDPASAVSMAAVPSGASPEQDSGSTSGVPAAQQDNTAGTRPAVAATGAGVSPRARALAGTLGVNTSGIAGSGPGGRVVTADVRAAADGGKHMTPTAAAEARESGSVAGVGTGVGGRVLAMDLSAAPAGGELVPYSGIRKLIGDRMFASLQNHAQMTLHRGADATDMMSYRRQLKASAETTQIPKVTVNDMLAFVVARALAEFPEVNGLFVKSTGAFERHADVQLAVAVDTPRGLMVPVVRDADKLTLAELSKTVADLAAKCRSGAINPDLLTGGTFTLTNLGAYGVERFTPILNTPQVGILGVGGIEPKPVPAEDGGISWQKVIGLSLTIDHQVVDGGPAAKFLQAVAEGIGAFPTGVAGQEGWSTD